MTGVKNQGRCGSCWAFAATSVQEGVQAIKSKTKAEQLSEQEGVDCVSKSYGCSGGWMSHYWEWTKNGDKGNPGGQSVETYADYNAKDNACRFQ